ncbi:MAG: methyltransferase type 11 [Dactylosporangium sp.]|jgi:hypothetical protein|nr:methyltransferase type 11 [Dactylosporangium sp.]
MRVIDGFEGNQLSGATGRGETAGMTSSPSFEDLLAEGQAVPDFTVARYRRQLADLHEQICREGGFVAHSQRYLIEVRKPT